MHGSGGAVNAGDACAVEVDVLLVDRADEGGFGQGAGGFLDADAVGIFGAAARIAKGDATVESHLCAKNAQRWGTLLWCWSWGVKELGWGTRQLDPGQYRALEIKRRPVESLADIESPLIRKVRARISLCLGHPAEFPPLPRTQGWGSLKRGDAGRKGWASPHPRVLPGRERSKPSLGHPPARLCPGYKLTRVGYQYRRSRQCHRCNPQNRRSILDSSLQAHAFGQARGLDHHPRSGTTIYS